jgi:hypothetical protein
VSGLKNLYRACLVYTDGGFKNSLLILAHMSNKNTFLPQLAENFHIIPIISPKLGRFSSNKVQGYTEICHRHPF